MAQEYYNLEKTAEVLKIPTGEVNRLREQSKLRAFRDGNNWKFRKEDVENFLTEMIKNRRKSQEEQLQPEQEEAELLSLEDDGDEDMPTLLADSASFDKLAENSFSGNERQSGKGSAKAEPENDLSLADDDLVLSNDDLVLSDDDEPLSLAEEDSATHFGGTAPTEKPSSKKTSGSDVDIAGGGLSLDKKGSDSGIDLGGDSSLDDDDMILGGSGSGSDINIAGDSGLSLLAGAAADSGFTLDTVQRDGSDASLELDDDDDILALVDETDGDTSTVLASESDFQLVPDGDGEADESDSSSQVIALEEDGMFMSDDGGAAMGSHDMGDAGMFGPDTSAFGPATGATAGGVDPFGVSPGAASSDYTSPQPVSTSGSQVQNYTGMSVGLGMVPCVVFLGLAGMMAFDLIRNMWSWGQPFTVSSVIMDLIVGK